MKAVLTFIAAIALAQSAFGKTGSDGGFEKLKTNVDNSKANLDDYKKNLTIVEANLVEIGKARATAEEQKRQVAGAVKENKNALGKMESQEKEINGLIADEKTKITTEEKKLAELEAAIARIKENRTKREANIQSYQTQLTSLQTERKGWQSRADALKEQETQVGMRAKELSAMENEWKGKKKGYEGEIGRWSKEVDKQEKSLSQFQALADTK